jgi:hypothetical protein
MRAPFDTPTWPPLADEWQDILAEIPADKHAAVQARIEEAVKNYDECLPRHACWLGLRDKLSSTTVTDLCELLVQTAAADPQNPARDQLLHLAEEIDQVRRRAGDNEKLYRPGGHGRRQRLYTWLLIAWDRDGGMGLSDSAEGPLVRFFDQITGLIDEQPISGETVRGIVDREKKRRAGLDIQESTALPGRSDFSSGADAGD